MLAIGQSSCPSSQAGSRPDGYACQLLPADYAA